MSMPRVFAGRRRRWIGLLIANGVHMAAHVAALVVAPGLEEAAILAALRESIDPVFLPRPLKFVQALPRSETGKLPRAELLKLL